MILCLFNKMRQTNLQAKQFPTIKGLKNLSAFTTDKQEKYDLITNKNSKDLLYRSNDWIDSLGAEKNRIRLSSTVNDDVVIKEIQKRHSVFNRKNYG